MQQAGIQANALLRQAQQLKQDYYYGVTTPAQAYQQANSITRQAGQLAGVVARAGAAGQPTGAAGVSLHQAQALCHAVAASAGLAMQPLV